jgi:phage-related protein
MSEDKGKGGLTAGLNKEDQKLFSKFLKSQVSSKEDSVRISKEEMRLQKEINQQYSIASKLQEEIADTEKEILELVNKRIKSSDKMKDLQDKIKKTIDEQADTEKELFTSNKLVLLKKKKIAELANDTSVAGVAMLHYLKQEVEEEENKQKLLETQLYQIDQYIKGSTILLNIERNKNSELTEQIGIQEEFLGNQKTMVVDAMRLAKEAEEHVETLHKAAHAAGELVEKYEEILEPFDEIDAWMQKIPGGGLMSKALGLDGIGKKIKQQIVDKIAAGEVAGKGLVASMGPLIPLLIAAGLLMKAFEFDKELTQFSKDLDVSKGSALEASNHADHLATHLGMANITGKEMGASMVALKEEFGDIALTNDKLVEGVTMLRERMGLTNEEAISLNSTATLLGTNLDELSASSMKMSEGLIGGKQMLKEMAKLPKSLIAGFKGTTKELQKAVIKGKLFGLTIEKAQSAGEGMLNIEESLQKEMTFNILAGKSMNLNKARQLALEGKTAELQDEILNQAGSLEDYQKMGPLQQKAMAEALNMSKEEMTEMLVKAQELKDAGLDQAKVEEVLAANGEERDKMMSSMDATQQGYLQKLIEQKNQEEASAKFQTAMNRLMEAFSKSMLPVVNVLGEILGYIGNIVDYLTKGVEYVNHFVHELSGATEPLKDGEGFMSKMLKYAVGIGAAMLAWSAGKKALSGLKSMIPGMGGGKATEAASSATGSADQLKGAKEGKNKVSQLLDGIKNIIDSIKGVVQSAIQFVRDVGKDLINTVKDLFNGIIDLVRSVGSNVLSTLQELIGGIGKTFQSIIKFVKEVGTDLIGTVRDLLNSVVELVRSVGSNVLSTLQELVKGIGNVLSEGANIVVNVGSKLAEGAMKILNIIIQGLGKAAGQLPAIMSALGSAVVAFFTPMAALVPLAPAIAIFTLAMIGLGYAFKLLGEGIGAAAPGIQAFFDGMGGVIEAVGNAIAKVIETITTSIIRLQDIDPLRLMGVAGGIASVGFAIAGFGAGAGAGGVMSAIGSFFDEDPVEKFNRFATIDSAKLVEVAGAIDKLGDAIAKFGAQVGKIGEVSGIIDTIDKVMELHDAVSENPISEAVEGVASAVGDIFSKAASFVTSSAPEASSVTTSTAAPAASGAAAAPQGSLKEVADLLKQILSATSQPVSINIGGKVIDEIGKQTTLRKTYSTKIDTAHGAFG